MASFFVGRRIGGCRRCGRFLGQESEVDEGRQELQDDVTDPDGADAFAQSDFVQRLGKKKQQLLNSAQSNVNTALDGSIDTIMKNVSFCKIKPFFLEL